MQVRELAGAGGIPNAAENLRASKAALFRAPDDLLQFLTQRVH
jgi:hypothetical protein